MCLIFVIYCLIIKYSFDYIKIRLSGYESAIVSLKYFILIHVVFLFILGIIMYHDYCLDTFSLLKMIEEQIATITTIASWKLLLSKNEYRKKCLGIINFIKKHNIITMMILVIVGGIIGLVCSFVGYVISIIGCFIGAYNIVPEKLEGYDLKHWRLSIVMLAFLQFICNYLFVFVIIDYIKYVGEYALWQVYIGSFVLLYLNYNHTLKFLDLFRYKKNISVV